MHMYALLLSCGVRGRAGRRGKARRCGISTWRRKSRLPVLTAKAMLRRRAQWDYRVSADLPVGTSRVSFGRCPTLGQDDGGTPLPDARRLWMMIAADRRP